MIVLFLACQSLEKLTNEPIYPDDIHLYTYEDRVAPAQDINGLHSLLQEEFQLYTNLVAPNGEYIHLLGQENVSRAQLIRARSILGFYLQDREGLPYGDKTLLFNELANTEATLLMFDTESSAELLISGSLGELDLWFQDLYATESPVEGSPEWLENAHRDASFEEIFHLVHGAGIDVVFPEFSAEIEAAAQQALNAGVWSPEEADLEDWRDEDSIGKEYIISVIDVYYGLWAHQESALNGEYQPNTRSALQQIDPDGLSLVEQFLPPTLDYEVRIDERFTGVFNASTSADWGLKSQYFEHIRLQGTASADIYGNTLDNILQGNQADNFLRGEGGDDTVLMQGLRSDYEVQQTDDGILLFDSVSSRDGADYLVGIEWVQFSDQRVAGIDLLPN